MRKVVALFFFLVCFQLIHAQVQTIRQIIKKMYFNKDTSKRGSFILVPVFSSAPETGAEFGGSALYSFYTDTLQKTNVSNIFGYASITTKNQTNLTLNGTWWLPGSSVHISGSVSHLNFPFNFYGIGNATSQSSEDRVSEYRFKLSFDAEKKAGDYLLL